MSYKIYTRDLCDFCVLAKRLLEKHNLPFEEYNLESHPHHRDELKEKIPDAKTVPQIFVGEKHIGGYSDLTQYIEETIESSR